MTCRQCRMLGWPIRDNCLYEKREKRPNWDEHPLRNCNIKVVINSFPSINHIRFILIDIKFLYQPMLKPSSNHPQLIPDYQLNSNRVPLCRIFTCSIERFFCENGIDPISPSPSPHSDTQMSSSIDSNERLGAML